MAQFCGGRSCIAGEASDNGLVMRTRVIGVVAIQKRLLLARDMPSRSRTRRTRWDFEMVGRRFVDAGSKGKLIARSCKNGGLDGIYCICIHKHSTMYFHSIVLSTANRPIDLEEAKICLLCAFLRGLQLWAMVCSNIQRMALDPRKVT